MLTVLNDFIPQDLSKIVTSLLKPDCNHQDCQETTGNCKDLFYCNNCFHETSRDKKCSNCLDYFCQDCC